MPDSDVVFGASHAVLDQFACRKSAISVDGFFQNRAYWSLTFKEVAGALLAYTGVTERHDATVLHVRRGDYVEFGGALGVEYYLRALATLDPRREFPVWIVADDELAQVGLANIITRNGYLVENAESDGSLREDLRCMIGSPRFIGANSTLSWWAAAGGGRLETEYQRVVLPTPWIHNVPDFFLPGWELSPSV